MSELRPGQLLRGKYRVERVLGEGGMGVVVLATHLRLEQLVAIKMLRPEARAADVVVRRFAREARAASRLRGEHSVRILDVDDSDSGDPFLVMEYLEGRDLQHLLAAEGPLSVATAASYLLQACEGIAEAHAASIVHRDLKPANLFLTRRPDGTPLVKLLDFGISKADEPDSSAEHGITKAETTIGSPSYMSPEQIKDAREVDARTDIWALGVVLYQMLTNQLPFEATTSAALAARIAADAPRPLREVREDVPEELVHVVERCLAKDRAGRFADVAELAGAIAPFAGRGDSGPARIARVIAAPRPRAAEPEPLPPRAPGASGQPTASIGDAPAPLLHEPAFRTEDASSVSREPSVAESPPPRGRGRRAVVGLVVVTLGLTALGVRVATRSPGAPAASAVSLAPAAGSDAPRGSFAATGAVAPLLPPPASAPLPASIDGGTKPVAPIEPRPSGRPTGDDGRPSAKPAQSSGKNPMDLDFK